MFHAYFKHGKKKNHHRLVEPLLKPINFKFVKKNEEPHISIRRVGVNAGKIDKNIDKSIQSHYFIKILNKEKSIDFFIDSLKKLNFIFDNTVGPKSISKQELIKQVNGLV